MNVEELHAIAAALREDLQETQLVEDIQTLAEALRGLATDPSSATFETQVASTMEVIYGALERSAMRQFPDRWKTMLDEMNLGWLLAQHLEVRIRDVFANNTLTPSVASEAIGSIADDLKALNGTITGLLTAFEYLSIGDDSLAYGEFELTALIPRSSVHDGLGQLGSEFQHLARFVSLFNELLTGARPPVRVRSIASSDFMAYLELAPIVAENISKVVSAIVAIYERLRRFKDLRNEFEEIGLTQSTIDNAVADANELASREIESIVQRFDDTLSRLADQNRAAELRLELHHTVEGLAVRVDRGYVFEVRVSGTEPPAADDGVSPDLQIEKARTAVLEHQTIVKEFSPAGAPILQLPAAIELQAELEPPKAPVKKRARSKSAPPKDS